MSIDPKGTAPGLIPHATIVPKTVSMRCRNPKCDSIEAAEIRIAQGDQHGQRIYRCVKCNFTKSLDVGGPIAL